ncbi:conserved hypothetical protein [Bacillus sp. 349Y]|nr:conserved hypothetical protein [Bacillus sp. 349Y]
MKFYSISKRRFLITGLLMVVMLASASLWYFSNRNDYPTVSLPGGKAQVFQLITGEFSSELPGGKKIEAYRWDPGTIVVESGKEVELRILGVNGHEHPFHIEGTNVTGVVKKGEETVVNYTFADPGTYKLVCELHETMEQNGPMIAYIVVQ